MATIRQHFENVADEKLRAKLLKNMEKSEQDNWADRLSYSIGHGFVWSATDEGGVYWEGVFQIFKPS
jgi:hypothetical protein